MNLLHVNSSQQSYRGSVIVFVTASGPSPAWGPVVPGPPIWNRCPHFTFGPPVATYIQYCILKMWPPFWFLAPSAAKSWRRAWTASENYCKCEPTYEVNVAEINSCEYKHQVEHFFLEHFGLAKYIKTNNIAMVFSSERTLSGLKIIITNQNTFLWRKDWHLGT